MWANIEIEKNIKTYIHGDGNALGVDPVERFASFDYCFNHFQAFRETGRYKELANSQFIQASCMQLGFYLASWGMYRGSAFLQKKSAKFLEPIIGEIAKANPLLWEIDANLYSNENIEQLLDFKRVLVRAFSPHWPTDTLITKIMLGVFGNVPAFDSFFRIGFGVSTFRYRSLQKIADFYNEHKETIERHRINTLSFETGRLTDRRYTCAKVIDMIFFIEGGKE